EVLGIHDAVEHVREDPVLRRHAHIIAVGGHAVRHDAFAHLGTLEGFDHPLLGLLDDPTVVLDGHGAVRWRWGQSRSAGNLPRRLAARNPAVRISFLYAYTCAPHRDIPAGPGAIPAARAGRRGQPAGRFDHRRHYEGRLRVHLRPGGPAARLGALPLADGA